MRSLIKSGIELVAGSRPLLATVRSIFPLHGVVLAYHNVVSVESDPLGDRSLHLPFDQFVAQLDWLAEAFEITALTNLVLPAGSSDARPRAAITFDDAYQGAVSMALPELVRRGLPATVFVCSDWVGGETPWWDGLAGDQGLSASTRAEALQNCGGSSCEVYRRAALRGAEMQSLPLDWRISSPAAIADLAGLGEIAIGSHTKSHPNLTTLNDDELRTELVGSLEATMARYPSGIPWLAYPYGISDERVQWAARAAGYEAALRVNGGPLRGANLDRYALPRINIPRDLSAAGFRIRCSGLR